MNPHISLPRPGGPASYGRPGRRESLRMPRFFKRLFKFPQMDFQLAAWELLNVMFSPSKVFRQMYYHKQTKNSWHRPDPSFTYLLSAAQLLAGLAWGLVYADGTANTLRIILDFVFVHFLLSCLLTATAFYFLLRRIRTRSGRFNVDDPDDGQLEFGFCWDVVIRAFVPVWMFLYVLQLVLMPAIKQNAWVSLFLGNTIYLVVAIYYFSISFTAYNYMPFMHSNDMLLAPIAVCGVLYLISLFGLNISHYLAPVLWTGAKLRKAVFAAATAAAAVKEKTG